MYNTLRVLRVCVAAHCVGSRLRAREGDARRLCCGCPLWQYVAFACVVWEAKMRLDGQRRIEATKRLTMLVEHI